MVDQLGGDVLPELGELGVRLANEPQQRGVVLVPMGTSDVASSAWLTLCEGSRIDGRFLLQRLIEHSEVHAVYSALDERVGRVVQVRLMPRPSLPDPRTRHPGLVTYRDRGCVGAWYAGVLDAGDGTPLTDTLARLGPLPVDVAVAIASDVLEALDHVHTHDLVHGSLAAERIHVGPDWHARILGFPERMIAPQTHGPSSSFGPLDEASMALAAPERWTGNRGDERTDVYAVGMLVVQMLTGVPPFGEARAAREGHFLTSLPTHAGIPEALYGVLRIATDKTPALRYSTAGAFRAALLGSIAAFQPSAGVVLGERRVGRLPPAEEAWIAAAGFGGETLDPAPRRVATGPAVLPAVLLMALCLLGSGVAAVAVVLAGAVFALSSPAGPPAGASMADEDLPVAMTGLSGEVRSAEREVRIVDVSTLSGGVVQVPVSFGYDSYDAVRSAGYSSFVSEVRERNGTVRLTGHTDDRGSSAANHLMGLGRAWSASLLMVADGVEDGRIELGSAGETQPIAPNDTAAGRAKNRRVTAEMKPTLRGMLGDD